MFCVQPHIINCDGRTVMRRTHYRTISNQFLILMIVPHTSFHIFVANVILQTDPAVMVLELLSELEVLHHAHKRIVKVYSTTKFKRIYQTKLFSMSSIACLCWSIYIHRHIKRAPMIKITNHMISKISSSLGLKALKSNEL